MLVAVELILDIVVLLENLLVSVQFKLLKLLALELVGIIFCPLYSSFNDMLDIFVFFCQSLVLEFLHLDSFFKVFQLLKKQTFALV